MAAPLIEKVRTINYLQHSDLGGIRRRAGASQVDVAAELGVHPTTIVGWESKKHRPRGELAERYVRLLLLLEAETRNGGEAA
jgi:DNA-binding XRE family transcriptional regulator